MCISGRLLACLSHVPWGTFCPPVVCTFSPPLFFFFFCHRACSPHRRERFQDPVVEAVDFYDHLLAALDHPVFQQGDWYYLTPQSSDSSWRLLSWRWALKDEDKRLVVVNYSDSTGAGAVVLDNAVARNGNDTIPVTDLMTGDYFFLSASVLCPPCPHVWLCFWWCSPHQVKCTLALQQRCARRGYSVCFMRGRCRFSSTERVPGSHRNLFLPFFFSVRDLLCPLLSKNIICSIE